MSNGLHMMHVNNILSRTDIYIAKNDICDNGSNPGKANTLKACRFSRVRVFSCCVTLCSPGILNSMIFFFIFSWSFKTNADTFLT